MGRSQESFGKKEREKKKVKKKKDKLQKKEERKLSSEKGRDLDDMLAYVDEFGNITSTPPDPGKTTEVKAEDIEVSIPKNEERNEADSERRGTVTFYNESKGFGFIRDHQTGESLFFHVNNVVDLIAEGNKVSFVGERGPKGMNAVNVRLVK